MVVGPWKLCLSSGDGELGDLLLEPSSRVLRSLPGRLEEMLVRLSVVQLDSLKNV